MKTKFLTPLYIFFSFLIMISLSSSLMADSAAAKSKKQKQDNLKYIVFLDTPLKNFGTKEQKNLYEEIKFQYSRALSFYFEDKFVDAYLSFLKLQKTLEKIYERLSIDYVERTELVLQGAVKTLVEVDVKYHRSTQLVANMLKDIEAPDERPYYEEKEFHFVYDKEAMVANMDKAYEYLGYAKKLRHNGINLQNYLEEGQKIPPSFRSDRIEKYLQAITLCRQAKRNGIRVYQLIERNKMAKSEPTYRKNPTFIEKLRDPVFDISVPADYVVDLNDALNRIHYLEVEYKVQRKKYQKRK